MGSAAGENERTQQRDRAAPLEYEGVHRMFDAIKGIPPLNAPNPVCGGQSRPPKAVPWVTLRRGRSWLQVSRTCNVFASSGRIVHKCHHNPGQRSR